jgi:hypothetical protein
MNTIEKGVNNNDLQFIKKAIEHELELMIHSEFEEAKKRIETRKSEIVSGVLLHVMKHVHIRTLGENVEFTIRFDNEFKK